MPFIESIRSVYILPTEIAGFGTALQEGFFTIGIDCEIIDLSTNPYRFEYKLPRSKLIRAMTSVSRISMKSPRLSKILLFVPTVVLRLLFSIFSFRRDVLVISMFGQSLLRGLDLAIARLFGACVISVFLGSDSRPPYLNGLFIGLPDCEDLDLVRREAKRVSSSVSRAEKLSDLVVCSPSTAQFLHKDFVNWFVIGMPARNVRTEYKRPSSRAGFPLRVVHIPSRANIKGTELISSAMKDLQDAGCLIEFICLENAKNSQVRELLEEADLVLDELYSDTFLGGLGSEAAALGKPTLTFGYAQESLTEWTKYLPAPLTGYADPDKLVEVLTELLSSLDRVEYLSNQQHEFITNFWQSSLVAERFVLLASGTIPESWFYPAAKVDYIWGCGVSKEQLTKFLQRYHKVFGASGFYLPQNSLVLKSILRLIESKTVSGQGFCEK
jgi:hypothetical protein